MRISEVNGRYSSTKVRWGKVSQKNLSSQLDSLTVVITHVSEMDIESYDMVALQNENGGVEYWLVANVQNSYVTFESPFLFDYTLDLMSLTKWLETITLPSMAITNIGQNRTIKSYIQRIVDRYVLESLSLYVSTVSYSLLDSRFDSVCPEQKFEGASAREVLDWLVGIYGCCIQVSYTGSRNIQIVVLDLNESKGAMPTQYIKTMVNVQNAEDYVTELQHDLTEVVGQSPITEYVKLKGEGYVFSSDTALFLLSHKPYDIKKCVLKSNLTLSCEYSYTDGGSGGSGTTTQTITDVDISNHLVLEEIYNTLELPVTFLDSRQLVWDDESETPEDLNVGKKYKTNCISWSRGSKEIKNVHYTEKFKKFFGEGITQEAILGAIIESWLEVNCSNPMAETDTSFTEIYTITGYEWEDLVLEITYIPYISPRLLVEQKDPFTHLVTMQDNTTNISTEIGKFLAYSLEKNSKLGNKEKVFTARQIVLNSDYTPVYEVGQYWLDSNNDKYIVSTLEYAIKENAILYKGTLTKNYTNQNVNTILNREKRYYALPDSGEAVTRKEVVKEWYKVDVQSTSTGTIDPSEFTAIPTFANITSYFEDEGYDNSALWAESVFGGNLIAYSVTFNDNISSGSYAAEAGTGGFKMKVNKYVDSKGEAIRFKFQFAYENPNNAGTTARMFFVSAITAGTKPLLASSYITLWNEYQIDILKDSRERISLGLEKIFYTENDDVVLGNCFAEIFNSTSDTIVILYTYTLNGVTNTETHYCSKSTILSGNFRTMLTQGTEGTLIIRKNLGNTANTYLTIYNYAYGDYIVFTEGEKRG